MNIKIVLGLGYGDEGKGATVNSLIHNPSNTIVVRFNGGHQVGHTVNNNGISHAFSNFGSGTLKGVSTYWSEFCTINPLGIKKEGDELREKGVNPMLYINANAMVTTPYDIFMNKRDSRNMSHGTVGVGFGKTIQRNEDHYHLYVRDLIYPTIRNEKIRMIAENYYNLNQELINSVKEAMEAYYEACEDMLNRYQIVNSINQVVGSEDLIFEGGQGIMLDMDYGFFPHVTRSNTTSKNAISIFNQLHRKDEYDIETFYVTRAYQTRHGNGFMSNENLDNSYIQINPDETNKNDGAQGVFRRAMLDLNQLRYALECDAYHNHPDSIKSLVVTCLDHTNNEVMITNNGKEVQVGLSPNMLGALLGITSVYTTNSDKGFNYEVPDTGIW